MKTALILAFVSAALAAALLFEFSAPAEPSVMLTNHDVLASSDESDYESVDWSDYDAKRRHPLGDSEPIADLSEESVDANLGDLMIGDRTLGELLRMSPTLAESSAALPVLRSVYRDMLYSIAADVPGLEALSMSREEAAAICDNGGLVLEVRIPGAESRRSYVPCPPDWLEQVSEIHHAYLKLLVTEERRVADLGTWAALHLEQKGEDSISEANFINGGSALELLDAYGNVVRTVQYSVPGVVH